MTNRPNQTERHSLMRDAVEVLKMLDTNYVGKLIGSSKVPFIKSIVSEIKEHGYSKCFTHAHTIREQKEIAYVVSICTGMRIAVELNVGLVEVVL
jgi:tRNA G26 N,N-dimethylase Trm1